MSGTKAHFLRDYHFPPSNNYYRVINLPDNAISAILSMLGVKQVMRLRKLNRHWLCRLQRHFESKSRIIETKFF